MSGTGYTLNVILLELLGLSAVLLQTQRAARCSSFGAGNAPRRSADVARCTKDDWDKDVRQMAAHCLPSAKCVSSVFWIQKSERSLSRIRKVARLDASFLTGNKKKKMKEKGKQRRQLRARTAPPCVARRGVAQQRRGGSRCPKFESLCCPKFACANRSDRWRRALRDSTLLRGEHPPPPPRLSRPIAVRCIARRTHPPPPSRPLAEA
jgi:hypothetical protein